MAIPLYPVSTVPVKLQKPAVILIPYSDSSKRGPLSLFYQAKDYKSFITWKKTNDTTTLKQYGGKKFYKINVNQLGWLMVGEYVSSCNCSITFPLFQQQKMSIIYPDLGAVVFFDNSRANLFKIPCGIRDHGFRTFTKAYDQSGHMFFLNRTFSAPEMAKKNIGIYKIRKRDYIKL